MNYSFKFTVLMCTNTWKQKKLLYRCSINSLRLYLATANDLRNVSVMKTYSSLIFVCRVLMSVMQMMQVIPKDLPENHECPRVVTGGKVKASRNKKCNILQQFKILMQKG